MTEQRVQNAAVNDDAEQSEGPSQPGDSISTADFLSAGSQSPDSGGATVAEQRPRADGASGGEQVPLFPPDSAEGLREQWTEIQAAFVDDPRQAVEHADGLVAETMKQLAQMFADERANLERQWQQGDEISTEDLRQALRRYRSFFDRLLSV